MRKIILSSFFALFISCAFAQNITGTWYGAVVTPGGKFELIFHIGADGNDYTTTMDSPGQKLTGIMIDKTTFANNQLTISGPDGYFTYTARYEPASGKINGNYVQGALNMPMMLSRNEADTRVARPQDPKDYPYNREEVIIPNTAANVELAGTLTIPRNQKVSKIVVLITGSGPENRDEEMFDHRPFLVLADWLSRQGIAVIRCDDRGVGKSTGDYATATTYDFAADAEAVVNYIKLRPDLKNMKVGLIGHSEGGVMASIVAGKSNFVDFVVLLASPGIPLKQLLTEQAEMLSGPAAAALNEKLYAYIIQNPTMPAAELDRGLNAIIYKEAAKTADGTIQGLSAKVLVDLYKGQGFTGPWFRKYVALEPANFIVKLKCPVLAINGTLDMVVRCDENLDVIRNSLKTVGNKNADVEALPGLNHLFQKATAGVLVTYDKIDETFNPVALKKVSDWINTLQ